MKLQTASPENEFSFRDHHIVRGAVARLCGHEHAVVMLRFWENRSVTEIAETLDLSWQEVERHLARALKELKKLCLQDPEFSHAQSPFSKIAA